MKDEYKCPVCNTEKPLKIGLVDGKVLAVCENKECESIIVFGEPIQKKIAH